MDKAMEMLKQLANKLGVTIEYLWTTLVKQQYVEGVTDIILSVFGIIVIVLLIIFAPKITKSASDKHKELANDRRKNGTGYNGSYSVSSYEEDHYRNLSQYVSIVSIVIGCIVLVLTAMFLVFGVQQLLNPDYFALKEVLNTISGSVQ